MGFLSDIVSVAAPIVGGVFGGPAGAAIGSAVGGAIAGGGRSGERATQQATQQQLQSIEEAKQRAEFARTVGRRDIRSGEKDALSAIEGGEQRALGFLEPLAGVGQQGIDLAGFLTDPSQQASFLESNPLFQLGLQNLNEQTGRSSAARGRLTAGDTLEQLQQNALLAGQPLIDRQRQDIMNLLGIGQNVAGRQVGIAGGAAGNIANIESGTGTNLANLEQGSSRQLIDLITGGGATQAAGTIAGENAAAARRGNIFDIGTQLAGNQGIQDFVGGFLNPSPTPSAGGFNVGNLNLSQQPLGIDLSRGIF